MKREELLCETICREAIQHAKADAKLGNYYANSAADLHTAHRFVLSEEVVFAAWDVIYQRPSSMLDSISFLRLPYKNCWFEFNSRKTHKMTEPQTATAVQTARIGF